MRRIVVGTVAAVLILVCVGGESRAGLFSRLFGARGSCAGGMCSAGAGAFAGVQSFSPATSYSASMMSYSAPMRSYSAPMRSYGAPMSFGAPTTYGSSCYSQSYSASVGQQMFSVPTQMMTYGAGAGGCYSSSYVPQQAYSVPVYRSVPNTFQAVPSQQTQASPSLPSKAPPSQEYSPTPSKSSPQGTLNRGSRVRRAFQGIQPREPEIPPTAVIGCSGNCCGGDRACDCRGDCGCGSSPGDFKEERKILVDYSGMTGKDGLRLVDYKALSETKKSMRTSMR